MEIDEQTARCQDELLDPRFRAYSEEFARRMKEMSDAYDIAVIIRIRKVFFYCAFGNT